MKRSFSEILLATAGRKFRVQNRKITEREKELKSGKTDSHASPVNWLIDQIQIKDLAHWVDWIFLDTELLSVLCNENFKVYFHLKFRPHRWKLFI